MSKTPAPTAHTPSTRPVRLRVAPSPTGDPHVGTAYMAMFDLAYARQQGGRFILRIEDTDRARFSPTSEQQLYDTLHWLALDEWLRANPDDPQAEEFRERGRRNQARYLRWMREQGFAT